MAQFTYNQEQAVKGGQSLFINKTGAYVGKIIQAKYTKTPKGAEALEFEIETDDGLKGQYISVFYTAGNGEQITSGHNMIQAIMGCTGVKELNRAVGKDGDIAPELTNKRIGLMLQKELFSKNDGKDSYRFHILCPFSATSRKTLAEHLDNKPAERITYLEQTTQDKDNRNKGEQNQQAAYAANTQVYDTAPVGQTYTDQQFDDIPF